MAIPARSIRLSVFSCFLIVFSLQSVADDKTDELVKHWASRLISQYLFYKSLGLLHGPFFLGIDGPPGVGKSSLVAPLKTYLMEEARRRELEIRIDSFRQDSFLKARSDRETELQDHGIGFGGNCDGREYRWEEADECVAEFSRGGNYLGPDYQNGLLTGPKWFTCEGVDILIFEGTHSLGDHLFKYMHATAYLDAHSDLIRHNRLTRELSKGKSLEVSTTIADVAESQYPLFINPNARRAQWVFRFVTESHIPPVELVQSGEAPAVNRSLEVVEKLDDDNKDFPVRLSELQTQAIRSLRTQRLLAEEAIAPRQTIAAAPGEFWLELIPILTTNGIILHIPARDGNCLFSALSGAFQSLGITSRVKALDMLRTLQQSRTSISQQVFQVAGDTLQNEIETLETGGWGGFTTLMYLWAAALDTEIAPVEPLHFVFRSAAEIHFARLNTDGSWESLSELPGGVNTLIYDGGTHWMWAEAGYSFPDSGRPQHPDNLTDSGYGENEVEGTSEGCSDITASHCSPAAAL